MQHGRYFFAVHSSIVRIFSSRSTLTAVFSTELRRTHVVELSRTIQRHKKSSVPNIKHITKTTVFAITTTNSASHLLEHSSRGSEDVIWYYLVILSGGTESGSPTHANASQNVPVCTKSYHTRYESYCWAESRVPPKTTKTTLHITWYHMLVSCCTNMKK